MYAFYMGIESRPKFIPEDDQASSENKKSEASSGKTDWSRTDKVIKAQKETESIDRTPIDWSRIEEVARKLRQQELAAKSSDSGDAVLTEGSDAENSEENKKVIPEQQSTRLVQQDIDEIRQETREVLLPKGSEHEYKKLKKYMTTQREQRGIHMSPEELAEEDRQLRKKFGLD